VIENWTKTYQDLLPWKRHWSYAAVWVNTEKVSAAGGSVVPCHFCSLPLCFFSKSNNPCFLSLFLSKKGKYFFLCFPAFSSCLNSPCKNGTCLPGPRCACFTNYYGVFCEYYQKPCLSSPCQHGGTCDDQSGDYNCQCPNNYQGETIVKVCINDKHWFN